MGKRAVSNLALFVDVRRKAAVAAAKAVAAVAGRHGVTVQVDERQSKELGVDGALVSATFPARADLVVSLGGDGTLLQAAHVAGPLGIPLMGIDFGRVGFLTEVSRNGYQEAIEGIIHSGITTEQHLALEARVAGTGHKFYAVNDVHIDRLHFGPIVSYGIELSGIHVASIPADGIIITSPTGSTAYFLSAGGPIMSPKLDAFGIAPISPHTLFSRPLIVSADEKVGINIPEDSAGTELFVDGQAKVELAPGSRVEIVRAARPVQFVRLKEHFFFETLERKLHWGMSIKRSMEETEG